MRLFLYIDGEPVTTAEVVTNDRRATLALAGVRLGRHAVTVRAIDSAGRWGGASRILTLSPEPVAGAQSDGKPLASSATTLHTPGTEAG